LLSPGGFGLAWNDYMSMMVEKLNALTVGQSTALPLDGTNLIEAASIGKVLHD
jgi:hypothetical protein